MPKSRPDANTTLYKWYAKRSGNHITIEHAAGTLTRVVDIFTHKGQTLARDIHGSIFILAHTSLSPASVGIEE